MSATSLVAAGALVAADKPLNEDTVRPGLIGLFFFVALAVATYFLWRSMNKQLKRVDEHFADEPTAEAVDEAAQEDALAAGAAEVPSDPEQNEPS